MTSIFLKAFNSSSHKTLVNVTSLLAIKPYKGLSLYSSSEFINSFNADNLGGLSLL